MFIWNAAPVVAAYTSYTTGATFESVALNALGTSDITQYFDHAGSVSQLIKGKSRDYQKLFKHYNGTTTSAFNLLSLFDNFHILILSHTHKNYFLLFCYYLSYYHYYQFHYQNH